MLLTLLQIGEWWWLSSLTGIVKDVYGGSVLLLR